MHEGGEVLYQKMLNLKKCRKLQTRKGNALYIHRAAARKQLAGD